MSRRNLADRLLAVEELLSSGLSPAGAARETSTQFGVGLRQAQKYVERVLESWASDAHGSRDERRNLVRNMAQRLYRECCEQEKWMPALRALDLLCKLDGLYPSGQAVVHEQADPKQRSLDQMTSGEKRQQLEELFVKANAVRAKLLNGTPSSVEAPGSPQLNSFGPTMSLAAEFLKVGEREVVLAYFDPCSKFWEKYTLKGWAKAVENGETPQWLMRLR